MEIMTDEDVSLWSARRGIEQRDRKLKFSTSYDHWIAIEMPDAAIKRMVLAGDLLLLGASEAPVANLIWISTWSIWDAWRDDIGEFIVGNLRAMGGGAVPLSGNSGHLLNSDEAMLSTALLWQAMLFNWDAFLIPSSGSHITECSHDEIVWINCKSEAIHNRTLESLAQWKPIIRQVISSESKSPQN